MRVLKILANGNIVLNTRGLRRIVDENGSVQQELVPLRLAKVGVETFNECFPKGDCWIEAITYQEAFRRQYGKTRQTSQSKHGRKPPEPRRRTA